LSQQPIPETCPANGTRSGQLLGFLFGLAPDGVFHAPGIAPGAVGSYPAFSPLPPAEAGGGLFSVALSVGRVYPSARVYPRRKSGVTRHRALWSSDFPPPLARNGSDSPPFQNREETNTRDSPKQILSAIAESRISGQPEIPTPRRSRISILKRSGAALKLVLREFSSVGKLRSVTVWHKP